jgi:hypothetical protein
VGPRRRHHLARGVGLLGGHGRGKRDAFLDARAELRVGRADEVAIALPDLASLHDAERFPPRIEAVRRHGRLFCPRQFLARPGEKAFGRRDDFGIGLLKGVGTDDQSTHGSIDAGAAEQHFTDSSEDPGRGGKPSADAMKARRRIFDLRAGSGNPGL